MKLNISDEFKKQFKKYDKKLQDRLIKAIDKLPNGDVKMLKGKKTPILYRLRVGDYRVIFRMTQENIFIESVDGRGDIYKKI